MSLQIQKKTYSLLNTKKWSLLYVSFLRQLFPFIKVYVFNDEVIIRTHPSVLYKVMDFLTNNQLLRFKVLADICGIDYPEKKNRFEVVYNLLSMDSNYRLTLTTSVREGISIDSVTSIFDSANWLEREVWDMFGVFFTKHPDMRRILTDYGFKGHPLRKDFPLTGFVEVHYDDFNKKIKYGPVSLAQDYRIFYFNNDFAV